MGARAGASGSAMDRWGFSKGEGFPSQLNIICSLLYYCHSSGGFANES